MPSETARPRRRLVDTTRGRRLLWELLEPLHWTEPWSRLARPDVSAPADDDVLPNLRSHVRSACDVPPGPVELRLALAATVDAARYWQPPDVLEDVLARPALREVLAPFADVVEAAVPAWWNSPFDVVGQHRVRWVEEPASPGPDAVDLAGWRATVLADEATFAAYRRRRPHRPVSGAWWSLPSFGFPTTTRDADGLPAVHLALVEDESGWRTADVARVTVDDRARVLEVTSADDWAALVARYPLEVSESRSHVWHLTTGRLGRWFVPDITAVAADHDAVHVSVAAYLDAAGEALALPGHPDAATVLAGWSPDETFWFRTDRFTEQPSERWQRLHQFETPWEWAPAG